jgi:D-tyrosyl-tRNA(Tyr) deacylase
VPGSRGGSPRPETEAMIAVLQRVRNADVKVDGKVVGEIGRGLLIFAGVKKEDGPPQATALAHKVAALRIFSDASGKMNLSAMEVKADLLVVSQFTLCADTSRGRRPSFDPAAPPEAAQKLYEQFVIELRKTGLRVETGVFRAHMEVSLINDGPVTFLCDTF